MSEGNLTDYTVTLRSREELDDFYTDMETEGGNITIPNRAVAVALRKPISRNTRYWLTAEEAEQVKQDERVLDVIPTALLQMKKPLTTVTGDFNKSSTQNADHLNWGVLRHTNDSNISNWGSDGTATQTTSTVISGTGKNVDVVIVDGHIDPDHPEFDNGSGTSRVIQYNWFQHDVGGGTGTYTYGTGNYGDNHGAHVAGTVAGRKYGWAPDANIYNIYIYGDVNSNGDISDQVWDYIREFHANKPINPATGRKNPTVVNGSYGSAIDFSDTGNFGAITSVTYRGATTTDAGGLTVQQLVDGGIYATDTQPKIPLYSTADEAEIQDAIAEGIIVVGAAGNESFNIAVSTDQDYNNEYVFTFQSAGTFSYQNRGTAPGSVPGVICVGCLDYTVDERKATFSNCGTRIDIFAAGRLINSAMNDANDLTGAGAIADSRNGSYLVKKISGTSMASPQVCGVLACLLESDPAMSPSEALDYIVKNAETGSMRDDGNGIVDLEALQGAPNRIMVMPRLRAVTGSMFPSKTFKPRPTSGITFPRIKRRRKG